MIKKPHKKVMMRHLKGWGIITLMVVTFLIYIAESKTRISYKVYLVENGYGYHIKRGDKVMIQQDFIPTEKGHQPFAIKEHAEEAAKLVVRKISDNQVPALTVQEINDIVHK